ncbi:MAG TPA: cupin domain-containing protein [Candidatus Baltobacteraceae bacterium]|nr:cupin domain-containing protein [Candidatus Baltobacteraceae bacterium]
MTTRLDAAARGIATHPFALSARQGRTRAPLELHGTSVLVKLASADTGSVASVVHATIPPMAGPPLHRHTREDEWFYVLKGEITLEFDGQRILLHPGDCAFSPRGVAHAFQNFGDTPAQMMAVIVPGQIDRLFEEMSAGQSARMEELALEYGVEILGPPLSQ